MSNPACRPRIGPRALSFAFALAFSLLGLTLSASKVYAAGAPEVPAVWVTDVTTTSANLRATIEPNGQSTTYRFEYLTEAAFQSGGWQAAKLAPPSGNALYGSSPGPPAFQRLEHLLPATTYRFRAVATNNDGPGESVAHLLNTEATPVASPPCPNDSYRLGAGSDLPDCRAYELISPPDKGGGQVAAPEALFAGGQLQAAPSGPGAITYGSTTSFGLAQGAPPVNQYLSTRDSSGWSTQNISPPLASSAYGDTPDGAPYRLFSTDLGAGLLFGGLPCRTALPGCPYPNPVLAGSGAPAGYMAYYLRDAGGSFASLLSAADLAHSSVQPDSFTVDFDAATPDLAHIIISSCAALTADAVEVPGTPGACLPAASNLYEWSDGALRALNLLPGDSETTPGALLAAPLGAISADGARVYFTTPPDDALYLREASGQTRLLPETIGADARFQAASDDGSIAYFTVGGELYRYTVASEASPPIAAGVEGVIAVSADGASVYYQDATGIQHWRQGSVSEVAPGADAALPSDYPPYRATARISSDGLHLAFLSDAPLPPFDNLDADTEAPDTELYLYGPPPGGGLAILLCASCNPTGERPHGSSSIPGTLNNGSTAAYPPRALSADAHRLFFDSSDRLVTSDTNSRPDVYQWQAPGSGGCALSQGCISLISSGRSDSGQFIDASADGADVYFLTGASLLNRDPGSADIYDARIGGGLPEPPPPFVCLADACQPLPGPPDDPTPGTTVPNSGNPPPKYFKPPKKRRHHRKHKKKRHKHGRRQDQDAR